MGCRYFFLILLFLLSFFPSKQANADDKNPKWGRYLEARGQERLAQIWVAPRLIQSPLNIELHKLYLDVNTQRREEVHQVYESWLAADPSNKTRRLVNAFSLQKTHNKKGDWCRKANDLLDFHTDDAQLQFEQAVGKYHLANKCKTNKEKPYQQIIILAKNYEQGLPLAIQLQLKNPKFLCNKQLRSDIRKLIDNHPAEINVLRHLWASNKKDDKCFQKIRKQTIKNAKKLHETKDPIVLFGLVKLYAKAKKEKLAQQMFERLKQHHPEFESSGIPNRIAEPEGMRASASLREANAFPSHQQALESLLQFTVPEDAYLQGKYFLLLGNRYINLEQPEKALASYQQAYAADPQNYYGRQIAKIAIDQRIKIPEAVALMKKVLENQEQEHYDPDTTYQNNKKWLTWKKNKLAEDHLLYGWLLRENKQIDLSVTHVERSIFLHNEPPGNAYALLGLNLLDGGRSNSIQLLLTALQQGITAPRLRKETQQRIIQLEKREPSLWYPNGLRNRAYTQETFESNPNPFIGKPFPIKSFSPLVGQESNIDDISAKVYVVDIWATWCGPCVLAMPHLQDVANTFATHGVRVIGLSIDEESQAPKKFFRRAKNIKYNVGWVGPDAKNKLAVKGIPAMFVLDQNRIVKYFILGYGGKKDTRLDEAVKAVLQEANK